MHETKIKKEKKIKKIIITFLKWIEKERKKRTRRYCYHSNDVAKYRLL